MRAVVVAAGGPLDEDARHLDGADLIVAADGGARTIERWGRLPQLVVGDLDSLGEEAAASFAARGVEIVRAPVDKDETDLELAVELARQRGATEIVVLGALGGERTDYDIANALLVLAWGSAVRAVRGRTTVRGIRAGERLDLEGAVGDRVSLVPGGPRTSVGTEGLRFPLRDEPLAFASGRGMSNQIVTLPAAVRCLAGALLVIEERR